LVKIFNQKTFFDKVLLEPKKNRNEPENEPIGTLITSKNKVILLIVK